MFKIAHSVFFFRAYSLCSRSAEPSIRSLQCASCLLLAALIAVVWSVHSVMAGVGVRILKAQALNTVVVAGYKAAARPSVTPSDSALLDLYVDEPMLEIVSRAVANSHASAWRSLPESVVQAHTAGFPVCRQMGGRQGGYMPSGELLFDRRDLELEVRCRVF
jgi:hypothetical protein